MSKKCPKCSGPTQLNGIRNGVQGWRCPSCGAAGYDTDRKRGGQLGGTPPASGADRVRKCRENKKKNEEQS